MQSPTSLTKPPSILSQATDNSLNVAFNASQVAPSGKRKASDLEPDSDGSNSTLIVAKGLSFGGRVSFAPVTLVARACLPLAWLSPTTTSQQLVFQARIPSVEEWEQRVLIVERVPNGGLHAVEQVAPDTYVASALHSWVTEAWCRDAAIGKIAYVRVEDLLPAYQRDGMPRSHSRTASDSSAPTALPTPKSPPRPKNRRGALARMSILGQGLSGNADSPTLPLQVTGDEIGQTAGTPQTSAPHLAQQPEPSITQSLVQERSPMTPAAQLDPQNPFDTTMIASAHHHIPHKPTDIQVQAALAPALEHALPNAEAEPNPLATERLRTQYFEHLYTSKTSLAFYVKGPLSRARAQVRTAEDPRTAITELSEFYVESILPTKKVDLKYKESLVAMVKALPVVPCAHDETIDDNTATETTAQKRQPKKSRKKTMKLGKDGLWSDEEEFIARWWRGREMKGTIIAAIDHVEEMRKELADLRMRETKMQLLLILEVMLLETAAATLAESEKPVLPEEATIKVESFEEDSGAAVLATTPHKQPKKEKKRNWSAEIDTILDRLCIWHTVSLDDSNNTADDNSSKKGTNGSTASKPNDALRDFCKEVLLPFYSAKIPEQIKSVCRKLGGPEISPKRPKPARPAPSLHKSSSSLSSLSKAKPGQTLSKRTLERVLSEDHQLLRHASPPTTFSRASSITAATMPTLKREPSERPASRAGMLSKSASFSNREIDLVADQKAHEAKRRKLDKLAQQKKELEAAIDALKKPDRRAAASQVMDEAEERKRLELEKRMAVQISATPRTKRVKRPSQLLDEPELPPMLIPRLVPREQDTATVIPSSTIKPRVKLGHSSAASMPRSSATKRAVLAAIHETPSRGFPTKTSNPLALPAVSITSAEGVIAATPAPVRARVDMEQLPSSELALRSSQPRLPSSQPTDGGQGLLMRRSGRPVLFTPIKKSEARLDQIFRDAPEVPEKAGRMMDRVMGARGIDEGFESLRDVGARKPVVSNLTDKKLARGHEADDTEGDIYDRLGWNDDFDL